MTFSDSISSCFGNYATFEGRAKRSEFWYWQLFTVILSIATAILDLAIFPYNDLMPINLVSAVLTLLPGWAVSVRRLHDINRSGWWILLALIPIIGWVVLLYWYVQPSTEAANDYGMPQAAVAA